GAGGAGTRRSAGCRSVRGRGRPAGGGARGGGRRRRGGDRRRCRGGGGRDGERRRAGGVRRGRAATAAGREHGRDRDGCGEQPELPHQTAMPLICATCQEPSGSIRLPHVGQSLRSFGESWSHQLQNRRVSTAQGSSDGVGASGSSSPTTSSSSPVSRST